MVYQARQIPWRIRFILRHHMGTDALQACKSSYINSKLKNLLFASIVFSQYLLFGLQQDGVDGAWAETADSQSLLWTFRPFPRQAKAFEACSPAGRDKQRTACTPKPDPSSSDKPSRIRKKMQSKRNRQLDRYNSRQDIPHRKYAPSIVTNPGRNTPLW